MIEVLAVASEYYPLVKTGGLADVVGALPAALKPHGVATRTLLPGYPGVMQRLPRGTRHDFADLFGRPCALAARGELLLPRCAASLCARRQSLSWTGWQGLAAIGGVSRHWVSPRQRSAAASSRVISRSSSMRMTGRQLGAGLSALPWRPCEERSTARNLAFQGQFPSRIFAQARLAGQRL